MKSRTLWTASLIIGGVVLMVVSYFFLTAPWGSDEVANSNPRMQWAPLLFVVGVIMAFMSAVVYELLPEKRRKE